MSFDKRWEKNPDPTTYEKVKEAIKPSEPLKSRLNDSIKQIEEENQHLNMAYQRFQERDKMIFNKIVEAYTNHDTARANVYANELVEVRKMQKMIFNAKLALEQIALRMRTVTELGDVAATLMPIVSVISDLKLGIASINPETVKGLNDISELINGMVVDSGALNTMSLNFESMSTDSTKILSEVQTITESRMGNTFPELPKGKVAQLSDNDSKNRQ